MTVSQTVCVSKTELAILCLTPSLPVLMEGTTVPPGNHTPHLLPPAFTQSLSLLPKCLTNMVTFSISWPTLVQITPPLISSPVSLPPVLHIWSAAPLLRIFQWPPLLSAWKTNFFMAIWSYMISCSCHLQPYLSSLLACHELKRKDSRHWSLSVVSDSLQPHGL